MNDYKYSLYQAHSNLKIGQFKNFKDLLEFVGNYLEVISHSNMDFKGLEVYDMVNNVSTIIFTEPFINIGLQEGD